MNTPLDLPLNLPMQQSSPRNTFENSIIIDRPCKSLSLVGNSNAYNKTSGILPSNDDDGRKEKEDFCMLDDYEAVYEAEAWWNSDTVEMTTPDNENRFSAIALPYLPFFSNCDGFDSHISLSRLIEEHPNCTIVSNNETNEVRQISFSKENDPFGDYCMHQFPMDSFYKPVGDGAGLQCQFEEQVDSASEHFRWFETKAEGALFYITQDAIPSNLFTTQYGKINGKRMALQQWGRSDQIVHEQTIPVIVSKHFGGLKNTIPREVTLELQYYQMDRYTKRLVSATLYYNNLCTVLKPEHFGGDPNMLREMKDMNILPCDVDINGNLKSRSYGLYIALYPLDWFHLLNKFQFHGLVYFGYFTLAGFVSISIGFIIWSLNWATTKLRHPPKFHGMPLLKLLAGPSIFGSSLATVAFICCFVGAFASMSPSSTILAQMSGDWYTNITSDNDIMTIICKGRTGTVILVLGIYMTITSTSFIIRQREDPDKGQDEEEKYYVDPDSNNVPSRDSWTPTAWKRAHFILCSFSLECCLLCVWELSYSKMFEANLHRIILFSKVIFVTSEMVITRALKEKLLCAPLLITIGITEVIVTMGSTDFVDFTVLFFLQITTTILHRLYIDPGVKSVESLWPRWRFVLIQKLRPRARMTVHQKREEEKIWRKINEDIELRNEGVEPLIDAIALCSINITTRILSPIAFVLIATFYSQSEIAEHYAVSATEVTYYALFCMGMIPWSIFVDVMVFNAQELVHGWRLYDYLVYQRHRFGSRDFKWTLNCPHFDESILEPLQSIDLMSFSSQYYFVTALLSGSFITTLFGGTILLRTQKYSFLADPALPLIVLGVVMLIRFLKHMAITLASIKIKYLDWEGIWGAIQVEGTLDDMIATKLAIGEGRQVDLEKERIELQALNNEKFRQRFLERNRPWILRHLVELFAETDNGFTTAAKSKLIDYTRGVYAELLSMSEGDKRLGDRPDISSDDDDDSTMDKRRSWDRAAVDGMSLEIAKLWLAKARKRRLFMQSVSDLIQSNTQPACSSCSRGKSSCQSLNVHICRNGRYDPTAVDYLISRFEKDFPSSQNDVMLWKSFFRQNAEVMTLCNICLTRSIANPDTNKQGNEERLTRPGDISSDEDDEENVFFEPLVIDHFSPHGRLLSKWLLAARRKIGGSFPRSNAPLYSQKYIELLKRSQGKKTNTLTHKTHIWKKDEAKWKRMQVEESSKMMASRWLMMARDSNNSRFHNQGETIRNDLNTTLVHMEPIDDWYYSEDLRLEGLQLQRDATSLHKNLELKVAQEAQVIKDMEETKDSYVWDMECKLKWKHAEFSERMKQLHSSHDIKSNLRVRELQNTLHDSSLNPEACQHMKSSISSEQKRAEKEWKTIQAKSARELEQEIKVIKRDIREKENGTKLEVGFIREQYKGEIETKEKEFRERAMEWLLITKRKMEAKQ